MTPAQPTASLQEQWFLNGPQRSSFLWSAQQAALGVTSSIWRACDGLVCALGGYYYASSVGAIIPGVKNANPSIAAFDDAVLAGQIVSPDGVNWVVASGQPFAGQAVGLINGAIVLPGQAQAQAVPAPPPAPPAAPNTFMGIVPIPIPITSTGGVIGPNPTVQTAPAPASAPSPDLTSMAADIAKIKAALASLGVTV